MCRLYGTVLRLILARIYGPIITLNKEAFYGGLTHRQRVSWLIHTYCVWLVVLPYHGTNEMVHLKIAPQPGRRTLQRNLARYAIF